MTASPDTQRPEKKKRRRRGRGGPGRPAEGFQERMVASGTRMLGAGFSLKEGVFEWINDDEIIRLKGFEAYDQMRHDDTIKAALAMKTAIVAGRQFMVKPAGEDEKAKEVAQFVQKQLEGVDFNEVMHRACTMFTWGYSLAEVVWTHTEWKGAPAIGLKKVAFRDPRQLRLFTNVHGDLIKVEQEPVAVPSGPILLDIDRLFHVPYQSEFGNPHGISDLRACYKNWWAKKFIIQFWNVMLERLGAPLLTVKYPQGASPELKRNIKNILRGLSAKTEVMVPEGVEFELVEATRAGNGDFSGALSYHDVAIGKAVLVPALLGFTEGSPARGSDSQSRLHLRTLFKMAGRVSNLLKKAFHDQVVKKLVDFNFDVDEYPEIEWGDYGEFEAFELTDAIRLLHAAGILELDQADLNYARGLLGLPLRDEDEEVIRPPQPPPPASANAPPPPAAQGNQRGAGGQARTGSGGSTGAKGGGGQAGG